MILVRTDRLQSRLAMLFGMIAMTVPLYSQSEAQSQLDAQPRSELEAQPQQEEQAQLDAQSESAVEVARFGDLSDWRPLSFPGIERQSRYTAVGGGSYLRVDSENSASMLVWENEIDVAKTPILTWRWRVDENVTGADLQRREADDAPLRLYVAFRTPIEERPWVRRAWARLQIRIYGEEPPDSALGFVWTDRRYQPAVFVSPVTDRQYVVPVIGRVGEWSEHSVDVERLYRRHFGDDPPAEAYVAIMGDSDNTASRSTAYVEFVRLEAR